MRRSNQDGIVVAALAAIVILLLGISQVRGASLDPSKVVVTDASTHLVSYAGTACTNQALYSLSAAGVGSCVSAALTKTDDTNVTLTLGGSPTNALLNATSLTLGWTGKLGLSRGGTNADLSATGGTSQVLKQVSSGAAVTVGQLACADLSTAGTACAAASSSFATAAQGTKADNAGAVTGAIKSNGSATFSQAACADLSNGAGGCSMSTTAGGDLTGTLPSPTVAKINGVALGTTTATSGNYLRGNGSAWASSAIQAADVPTLNQSTSGNAATATALQNARTINGVSFNGTANIQTATSGTSDYTNTSWTPADASGAALTFSAVNASYTKIGNMVFAYFTLTYPVTANGSNALLSGLPVGVPLPTYSESPGACWGPGLAIMNYPNRNSSTFYIVKAAGAIAKNSDLSTATVNCMVSYPAS